MKNSGRDGWGRARREKEKNTETSTVNTDFQVTQNTDREASNPLHTITLYTSVALIFSVR